MLPMWSILEHILSFNSSPFQDVVSSTLKHTRSKVVFDASDTNIRTMFVNVFLIVKLNSKIVSEYDQEIPRSQTVDKPVASVFHRLIF